PQGADGRSDAGALAHGRLSRRELARARGLRHVRPALFRPPEPDTDPALGGLQRPPAAQGVPGRGDRHGSRDLSRVLRRDRRACGRLGDRLAAEEARARERGGLLIASGAPGASSETAIPVPEAPADRLFAGEEMELSFGPQHPSTHGVLRLNLKIDGERIVECSPFFVYLTGSTEKLFELHPFFLNVPHTDRMDYVAAATNNLAYVGAVEKLIGLVVPPRARVIRTILAELQRIASHLVWLATHAIDIGAMTPFFYCFRERELVLDLFEQYCGA